MKTIIRLVVFLLVCWSLGQAACTTKESSNGASSMTKELAVNATQQRTRDSLSTPFGRYHKEHVHQLSEGALLVKNIDGTHVIVDSTGKHQKLKEKNTQGPTKNRKNFGALPIKHAWLNYASFYVPEGIEIGSFKASYIVPERPANSEDNSTLYYFIGIQDNNSKPLTILQPVLAWNGNGIKNAWSLSSWNCCPKGQVVHSKVISGMKAGDTIETLIQRQEKEYKVSAKWNQEEASLTIQTGTEFFNWANLALEVYDLKSCDNFAVGPMIFTHLAMQDTQGKPIAMDWQITGNGAACATRLELKGTQSIMIQQN